MGIVLCNNVEGMISYIYWEQKAEGRCKFFCTFACLIYPSYFPQKINDLREVTDLLDYYYRTTMPVIKFCAKINQLSLHFHMYRELFLMYFLIVIPWLLLLSKVLLPFKRDSCIVFDLILLCLYYWAGE